MRMNEEEMREPIYNLDYMHPPKEDIWDIDSNSRRIYIPPQFRWIIGVQGDHYSEILTFRKIILPEIWPGIVSGAVLAFTLSLDDVIISYFTTGPGSNTLPLQIYSMIKTGITPDVNALTTLIILVVMIILFIILQQ